MERTEAPMNRHEHTKPKVRVAGWCLALVVGWAGSWLTAALGVEEGTPAHQRFRQEVARHFGPEAGLPAGPVRLLARGRDGGVMAFVEGTWYRVSLADGKASAAMRCAAESQFVIPDVQGGQRTLEVPWGSVRQLVQGREEVYVVTDGGVLGVSDRGMAAVAGLPSALVRQAALDAEGGLWLATGAGLFRLAEGQRQPVAVREPAAADCLAGEVLGIAVDRSGAWWAATAAGVVTRSGAGLRRLGPEQGLPWNEFTAVATGPGGEVWLGTKLGAIRFEDGRWHYRQGRRWLADDTVRCVMVDHQGNAWLGTEQGLTCIERRPMSLAEKAEYYEEEIARYVKRTPYGFVAEAALRQSADRASANPQDSDNDGLWTAMYGAGECFGYAATGQPRLKERARQAFEALRFLQKVTQGGPHTPPKGFVARTVRPVDWPDPNPGSVERDRAGQKGDRLWKAYEPRWPRSADGNWFWKSDTSSDELDGHYFFYPLYYDFCADTEAERERVREVVRDLTDHLVTHGYRLVDHDGRPTRWGIYDPASLNNDVNWWGERGLKSLSMLSYLAVAAHVTGDAKYEAESRRLIDEHGYAHNAMYPKIQHGPGSGNQSDDEMAFMCFYNLLRYSRDEALKNLMRISFFRYWCNEQPEANPFFNFAYAPHTLGRMGDSPYGPFPLSPWKGWHAEAMRTLYGFPLDRLNWGHRNSHRLDVVSLWPVQANDFRELEPARFRGRLRDGQVLPVENRHFNHWNTDPWRLDYGGQGDELAAGTVFLLPYYLGLYHGYIEKP